MCLEQKVNTFFHTREWSPSELLQGISRSAFLPRDQAERAERYDNLVDEFSLLTIIAFDEIATCRGYSRDRDFYAGLGHPAFLSWIKETIADEVTHATNAVRVIHKHHAARLGERDDVLDRWMGSATPHQNYRGTFLMDSLDPGYFRTDFPDFRNSLGQLFRNPELLDHASGKTVVL